MIDKEKNNVKKSAFIAIVGRPNVGKSSIMNKLLGTKVAIVSNKPQTTRTRIMGVLTDEEYQLVFIDTPGLHRPKTALGELMVRSINESVSGVDGGLLVTEAGRVPAESEKRLIEKFKQLNCPVILAINKIDTLKDKALLLEQIQSYNDLFAFKAIVPVSALKGDGMQVLLNELKNLSVNSSHYFDSDTLTDQPERVLAAEMIREKILRLLNEEIPHGTAVVVEKMKQRDEKDIIDIDATIYCEKETHKGIIIGRSGQMLKRISTYARQDMERFFCCKINLQTWVKIKEDWRNREHLLLDLI